MKTPFDSALRVQQRSMEAIRIAISLEISQQTELERAEAALIDSMRRESAIAAQQTLAASSEWLVRMRAHRQQLRLDAEGSRMRLALLRAQAAEAYGTMHAIENAAERHRENATREEAGAEQARLDDFSAARLVRARAKAGDRRTA